MPVLMADEKYELNLSAGDLPNNFTRDFSRNFSNTSLENFFRQYQTSNHFHRVDSEDQFRKFLEKIPSTTNLAAIAQTNGQAPQANGDAISQGQMFPMSYGMPSSSPLSAQLPEQGALHVGGIPRVASLDLLRQLMGTPGAAPQMKSSLAVKEEPRDQSNGSESMHIPSEQNPAFNLPPLGMRMSSQATLPRSGSEDHIPSGEPSTSYLTNGAVEDMAVNGSGRLKGNKETGTQSKAEQRRARRMLSNRESARRSRRRKQEHLGALEDQIANLETEKEQLAGRNEKLQRQLNVANEHNSALKRELEELRQQLGIEAPEGSHKRSRGA